MKVSLALVIILSLLAPITVSAIDLADTTIDYTDYKEITKNSEILLYKIKITNTGRFPQTYEIIPDSDAIKSIGTYSIEPSSTARLMHNESQTFNIHIYPEQGINGRVSIPVHISSANATTTVELAARAPHIPAQNTEWVKTVLKIAFYTLIAIILITLILSSFRKNKNKDKEEEKPEVEEYY